MRIKEYALVAAPISEATDPNNMTIWDFETHTTQDAKEIVNIIETRKEEPDFFESHCIEEYWVDEEGDFIGGSDFDTIENFLERNK